MLRFLRLRIALTSIPIVITAGFLGGMVVALQMARVLGQWGHTGRIGPSVWIVLMRELGPVLTGLIVAWRFSFRMASEQRAQKASRVMPFLIATIAALPLLTLITVLSGMTGGWLVNTLLATSSPYWGPTMNALEWGDLVHGLSMTFIFDILISLIACYYSLRTSNGMRPNPFPPAGIIG